MSWAKHDPEGWMRVCRKGVTDKLNTAYHGQFGEWLNGHGYLLLDDVLASLAGGDTEDNKIWDALMTWANKEVTEAEASYLSELMDFADAQRKAAREKG